MIWYSPEGMLGDNLWYVGFNGTCWYWARYGFYANVGEFCGVNESSPPETLKCFEGTSEEIIYTCPTPGSCVTVTACSVEGAYDSDGRCVSGDPSVDGTYVKCGISNNIPEWCRVTPGGDWLSGGVHLLPTYPPIHNAATSSEEIKINGDFINIKPDIIQQQPEPDIDNQNIISSQTICECVEVEIKVTSTCCLACYPTEESTGHSGWAARLIARGPAYLTAVITQGNDGCCGPLYPTYGSSDIMEGDDDGFEPFPLQLTVDETMFDVSAKATGGVCKCWHYWCRDQAHCSNYIYPSCEGEPLHALYLYRNGKFYVDPRAYNIYQQKLANRKRIAPKMQPRKNITKKIKLA
jgi:hypothetical protein